MNKIDDLLARDEISRLRIAYSNYFDGQNPDALAELFTQDAVCEFGEAYGGSWVGRDTIRANYAREMKRTGSPFDAIHVVTNPWIELTGETTAKGRWYLIDLLTRQKPFTEIETRGGHDNPLLFLAMYEDEYRLDMGSWRISRTKLRFLWPDRSPDEVLPGDRKE